MKEWQSEIPAAEQEKRHGSEVLRSFLDRAHNKLNTEIQEKQSAQPEEMRMALDKDFRIIPPKALYTEAEKKIVRDGLMESHDSDDETVIETSENSRAGFLFEMLKTSIMHKNAGDRFIVVRTSRYDDIHNKVDNVFVDRKTGNIVCAFDECSPKGMNDETVQRKRKEIKDRNFGLVHSSGNSPFSANAATANTKMGMTLKYGVNLDPKSNTIKCEEVNELPLFLLNLDQKHLNEALEEFKDSDISGEYENKLFKYFLSFLSLQIQDLKLDSKRYNLLPAKMKERIKMLEDFLSEIKYRK